MLRDRERVSRLMRLLLWVGIPAFPLATSAAPPVGLCAHWPGGVPAIGLSAVILAPISGFPVGTGQFVDVDDHVVGSPVPISQDRLYRRDHERKVIPHEFA